MIGRGLIGEVERDLEAVALGLFAEPVEVLEGAEPRFDGVVSAVGAANRPRAAGVVRARLERVVRPLRLLVPIG